MSSTPPRKRLPIRPSLENLRKQAKRAARSRGIHLTEAQQQLAREYGFASWEMLAGHVTALREHGEPWRRSTTENLPKAANASDVALIRTLLDAGDFTQHELDLALARAVMRFRERREIAELLVEHGADPDGQYGADYGPIVFATAEALDPDGLQFLIDHGADVTFAPVATKYGVHCPLSTVLDAYIRGHNAQKHRLIDILLAHGAHVPSAVTPPVLAIHRGDPHILAELLEADPALAHRTFADMPYGILPLAGGALIHCAVEFGELACLDVLVERGAEINAAARDGGRTPIYHALASVADSNFYTLEHLHGRYGRRVDLGVRATWPGQPIPMTPLEYAEHVARTPTRNDLRPRIAEELALLRGWSDTP